mmetsp:Transcript_80293/g.146456  ORF Transcript_80293/g.146456 Transcript_80293/m.146456 type:complete len:119 (-) Transcript_80293:361-717(-)
MPTFLSISGSSVRSDGMADGSSVKDAMQTQRGSKPKLIMTKGNCGMPWTLPHENKRAQNTGPVIEQRPVHADRIPLTLPCESAFVPLEMIARRTEGCTNAVPAIDAPTKGPHLAGMRI